MAIEEETVIRREGIVKLIVFFGGLICALNTGLMYMAYLKLMEVFHTDLSTVQWLTIMFAVTSAMVTPTASYFARRYSLRNALMAALVVMTAASFCCTLAPNIHSLIVCRALQGAASGMMTPLTMAIIYQWIPKEKQGRFLSISLMGMSLGPAIGPTLSGFFLATTGWQAIFLCNVPITLLNLYLVFRVVPKETGNAGDSLDYNSMITVFAGTMLILLSFYQAGRIGWAQPAIGLGIMLGSALLYLFVRRQLRAEKPMLDFRIFHSRKFTVSVIVSAVLYANVTLIAFLMPIFLQKAKGMEPLPAGMLLFFPAVGMALATPLAGRVYEKVSARTMLLAGLGAMLLGNCLITGFNADTATMVLVGCMMIRYVGAAFA
ncbi:MAG: MFS transporter, partial [Peptococcaceae bacterium]